MGYGLVTAFIFLLTGLINPVLAQQQIFKNYTVNDGLVSNSIRRIFQDSKGFLWIGTWEGISKYDGYTFTNYSTANGLSHNMVNDFYGSKDGKLFVALNNGSIDMVTDNAIIQGVVPAKVVVNSFTKAPGYRVIVSTDSRGLQEFRDGKLVQPKQHFPSATYLNSIWLNDSVFMAVTDSSLEFFTQEFAFLTGIKNSSPQFAESVIYQDSKKRIWVSTYSGLKLISGFPPKNTSITFTSLPAPFNIPLLQQRRISSILEDADGTLWFGTSGGLIKININGSYQLITVKDGLASNIVTTIFQDKEQNIWFGTAVGFSKLVTKSGIRLYPLENGIRANDNLYLMYPVKKNHLLISTAGDLQVFNKLSGEFLPVTHNSRQLYFNAVSNTNPPLLIGPYNMATIDTLTLQHNKTFQLPLTHALRMLKDKQGNYVVSSLETLYVGSEKKLRPILNYRITALLIDKKGGIWAGTWQNGLFHLQYDYRNGSFHIRTNTHLLPEENIRSLFEDTKGNIWAGTRYTGVYRVRTAVNEDFTILKFDQHEGLSSNFIKSIREDTKGNIWIAFYQGLDKLIPQASSYRIFNFSRVNNYFTSIIGMEIDADHSIWLATGEGLTHIVDGEMEKLPPLPVYITKVFSSDSVYPLHAGKIQLGYRQNQLQFEFSAPGYINEKQIIYSYRITGSSNTQWTIGSNQHIVSYASLQPGSYIFEVRTFGWNGDWGKPAAFEFIINPPFWHTGWFILLFISVVFSIVYVLIRKRIKGIQHEAAMKQQIAETEMMALRAQMNPHFIFNCLNSIDNLIQMDEKEKATSYLSKFAKLIRSILENSKNNVVPCWKDMETLQLYLELEALRFDNKFSYRIDIADEIVNGDYKVPPLVIQPFVENAIHHGLLNKIERDKRLFVGVSVVNNHIIYLIEDNGVGRQKAAAYKALNKPAYGSMGMQITADRIYLFNQHYHDAVKITDLYDSAKTAIGTKVEVTLTVQP